MFRKRRNGFLIPVLLLMIPLFSSCGSIRSADTDDYPQTTSFRIRTAQVIAEQTSTPEPVVIIREPVKNHSPLRIQLDAPDSADMPEYYQPVDFGGIPYCVYAYTDINNTTVYRVYAEVDELEDDNVIQTLEGFFAASVYPDGNGLYILEADKNSNPVNPADETPAVFMPCPVPTRNAVSSYIRNAKSAADKYNKAVASAEKKGEPLPEPTPWDGLPVLNEETPVISLPGQVKAVKRIEHLYFYTNVYGDEEYRRYATADGYDSGFYLSDGEGRIRNGSLKVDISADFDKSSFRSGKKVPRPEDGIYRLPVLVTLSSGETASVYTIYRKEENPR